jgi:hypothetical protein
MASMVPAEAEAILQRNAAAAPDEVAAVRSAFLAGTCVFNVLGFGRGRELRSIYGIRAEHLARFQTEHARRLRRDCETFCKNLERVGDVRCRFSTFDLDHGRELSFIEHDDTHELLGVLHTVKRGAVTPEEWASLWGTDVADEYERRRLDAVMTGTSPSSSNTDAQVSPAGSSESLPRKP